MGPEFQFSGCKFWAPEKLCMGLALVRGLTSAVYNGLFSSLRGRSDYGGQRIIE